jgi:WD40 repeat protein
MEKIVRLGKAPHSSLLLLLGEAGGLYSMDNYDASEIRLVRRFKKDDAEGLMCTDNGKGVLVYGPSGSVALIRTSDGKVVARQTAPAGIRVLCQIPGTNRLALGLKNGMIQIVFGLKKEEHLLSAHRAGSQGVNSLVYYQEKDLLISSGHDGRICFWDCSSFELAGTFHLFENGFLWTTLPDSLAPEGWFWTNKKELVDVWKDGSRGTEVMDPEESERYISLYNSRERVFQAIFRRNEYKSMVSQSRSLGYSSGSAKLIEDGT